MKYDFFPMAAADHMVKTLSHAMSLKMKWRLFDCGQCSAPHPTDMRNATIDDIYELIKSILSM